MLVHITNNFDHSAPSTVEETHYRDHETFQEVKSLSGQIAPVCGQSNDVEGGGGGGAYFIF